MVNAPFSPARRPILKDDRRDRLARLIQNVELLHPSHEQMRRSMGGFLIFSPFHLVQDLVSLVDPRANLLLPSKARRVFEIPDDAPILEMQFRREIELNQHVAETSDIAGGSERAGKPPGSARPATIFATCFLCS